jgi:hypothetical protein
MVHYFFSETWPWSWPSGFNERRPIPSHMLEINDGRWPDNGSFIRFRRDITLTRRPLMAVPVRSRKGESLWRALNIGICTEKYWVISPGSTMARGYALIGIDWGLKIPYDWWTEGIRANSAAVLQVRIMTAEV